jgi:hypothetical protein
MGREREREREVKMQRNLFAPFKFFCSLVSAGQGISSTTLGVRCMTGLGFRRVEKSISILKMEFMMLQTS